MEREASVKYLLSGAFSLSCATIAGVVIFGMVTTTFLSVVALWKGVLAGIPWPGPDMSLVYVLLALVLPLMGATLLGRAVYSWLQPDEAAKSRIPAGTVLGFAGWLVAAVVVLQLFWK